MLAPEEWRQYLTAEEAETIRRVEARMTIVEAELAELASIRRPIQNRAIGRAKHQAQE
jgi:hypothetical protein